VPLERLQFLKEGLPNNKSGRAFPFGTHG